jgi:hypothetical protein
MKVLKIDDFQGYYSTTGKDYKLIDKITKEDLLKLVELILEEEVLFDEFDENKLKNQAHQIVYKSISDKLIELAKRKDEFKDESERLFLQEYEKYGGIASKDHLS